MSKFRKKPVVIEAVQLRWATWSEMCDFANVGKLTNGKPAGGGIDADGVFQAGQAAYGDQIAMVIPTLEGVMIARQDDWIIKGVAGEFYLCKPDIFEQTYEAVE